MRGHLVLALLLVPMLAGCTSPEETVVPVGSMSLRAIATAEAVAWDPGARLVAVTGVETSARLPNATQSDIGYYTDPTVGDGLVPAWRFLFQGPECTRMFEVTLLGEETPGAGTQVQASERAREERDTDSFALAPVDEATVDARAALEAAKTDANFTTALDMPGARVIYFLWALWHDRPIWLVSATHDAGSARILVDATTGEILDLGWMGTIAGLCPAPPREAGKIGGPVSVTRAGMGGFELSATGHETLALVVEVTTLPHGDDLRVQLRSPSGIATTAGASLSPGADRSILRLEMPQPEPGAWTVEVTSTRSVQASFAARWCADRAMMQPLC